MPARSIGGARLAVTTRPTTASGSSTVRLPTVLFFRQTAQLRVDYDLPGGKPRSTSDIRVGPAFATFFAWALGDRGDVRGRSIPAGFEVETTGATVARRATSDGRTVCRATGSPTRTRGSSSSSPTERARPDRAIGST